MEGNRLKPRALLVFGAPCSGKTTFSEKFAKRFSLAFYDFDDLMNNYGFSRENILVILEQILKTGQTIIIEGGLRTEKERDEIRKILKNAGYDPALLWIQTDASSIRARLKSKYKSISKAKEVYDTEVAEIEAPTDSEHPIILSGKHTFETQSKHTISGLADLLKSK